MTRLYGDFGRPGRRKNKANSKPISWRVGLKKPGKLVDIAGLW